MGLNWNFQRGRRIQTKNLLWEGYGYFLEQHIFNKCHFSVDRMPIQKKSCDFKFILLKVRFFGRIQDWIFNLKSQGYFTPKETKNPKIDYFDMTTP